MTVVWNMTQVRHSPLFQSLLPVLEQLDWPQTDWPELARYQAWIDAQSQQICTGGGRPLRVVAQPVQAAYASQQHYEAHIYLTGELPTREANWHDLLNVLAWVAFPRAKAALNARHYVQLQARANMGAPQARSPEQDALTQFDESGVVLVSADPALVALLQNYEWQELFWVRREQVRQAMRCMMFGHGLMEKAMHPYIGMTGKGLVIEVPPDFFDALPMAQLRKIDDQLATVLGNPTLLKQPRDLSPVPILGFPGATPENASRAFYENRDYFRPGRRQ